MTRRTFDGHTIELWSDGGLCTPSGGRVPGLVARRRPKDEATHARLKTIGWLFMGELCLWSLEDAPRLYAACERAADIDEMPGTVRRLMRETRPVVPSLVWTVLRADRDGRPVERVARLNRIQWPGLVVMDFCGGPGSRRGRYVLMNRDRSDVLTDTGFAFTTLADLGAHLRAIDQISARRAA
jgi:hypothetical protein